MQDLAHWTQQSVADFVYSISSSFVAQLETKMEEEKISQSDLATSLGKSSGRVSQVFNNPGNLSLRVIVDYARALKMKVSLVAYDDGDPDNTDGPIHPNVFVESWEKLGCPKDLFEVAEGNPVNLLDFDKILWGRIEDRANGYTVVGSSSLSSFSFNQQPIPAQWVSIARQEVA